MNLRKYQLLHNSSVRMKAAARELYNTSKELLQAAKEMENIEDVAIKANLQTPIILRWWSFMRRESWIHLKLAAKIWWRFYFGDLRK